MAKNAKISLLELPSLGLPNTRDCNALVERMIEYHKASLQNVLPDKPDIIIVPEVCDRYAGMQQLEFRNEYYECRGDRVRDFYRKVAKENNCYVAYSAHRNTPWDEKYPYRNSTQIIGRDGEIVGIYDKNHLTIGDNLNGTAYGKDAPTFELDFGRVACAICFDLNFEELINKYISQKPNLIIFSSMYHGGLAQEYWAYRCRSYFAGAICGDRSRILNPMGQTVATSTNYYHYITHKVNFDYVVPHIDHNNAKFKAIKQKYGDAVTIHDPGYVGCVLMTCEDESMCIDDIVEEFEVELMDDYFERSLKHRHENLDY